MLTHRLLPFAATFLVGGMMSVQSRINGQLSAALGSGLEAAVFSFGSGLILVLVLLAIVPSIRRGVARIPHAIRSGELAWWQILGGIFGGFFVAVQSAAVPFVGVAVFTVAVVAGQSTSSLFVDRAGLGPAGRVPITLTRVISAVVAILAVILAVANRLTDGHISVIPVVFAVIAGSLTAVQQATNGRVSRAASSPLSATFYNFVFGTTALAAAFGVSLAVAGGEASSLPSSPLWMYLGGVIGVAFIAIAAWAVPLVGVLRFALLSIAGQLTGAVLLDIFAPTSGTELGWNLFAGVLLAFVAVAIGSRSRTDTSSQSVRESAA
jgi:transporter family-2 protein